MREPSVDEAQPVNSAHKDAERLEMAMHSVSGRSRSPASIEGSAFVCPKTLRRDLAAGLPGKALHLKETAQPDQGEGNQFQSPVLRGCRDRRMEVVGALHTARHWWRSPPASVLRA